MDPAAASSSPSSSSPRRELQGPRPSPLKVSKDSYKIAKKPPLFPHPHPHPHPYLPPPQSRVPQQQQQQLLLQNQNQNQNSNSSHRSPVIIYAVSPKVIHTTPSDFMSLVQRLTGNADNTSSSSSSSSSTSAAAAAAPETTTTLLLSPAAAAAASPRPQHHRQQLLQQQQQQQDDDDADVEFLTGRPAGAAAGTMASSSCFFPGILSPGPASLQPISPSLFLSSPSLGFDPSVLGYLSDLSPVLNGAAAAAAAAANCGVMLMSPGNNLLATPTIPSPGAFWDLLNQFPDF